MIYKVSPDSLDVTVLTIRTILCLAPGVVSNHILLCVINRIRNTMSDPDINLVETAYVQP